MAKNACDFMVQLNLGCHCLELSGVAIVTARETPKGWYWFSNVGRVGKKNNFKTPELALRAAAKTMGLKIEEEEK